MDSDEQSTESFDKFTFEFTLSNVESDSESHTSVEYIGTKMNRRQTQNCANGSDEQIDNSRAEDPPSFSLTQQAAATSLLCLLNNNEGPLNCESNNNLPDPSPIATSFSTITATNNSNYLLFPEIQNDGCRHSSQIRHYFVRQNI